MSSFLNRLLTEEEVDRFATLRSKTGYSGEFRKLLAKILLKRLKEKSLPSSEKEFDNMNWAEKRAYKDGSVFELMFILKLLGEDPNE